MKLETFERVAVNTLQEGDYVYIKLHKEFIISNLEYLDKMSTPEENAQAGPALKGAKVNPPQPPPPPPAPKFYDVSDFVVGRVDEVLPAILGLTDAFEEKDITLKGRPYEVRQCREIRKISEKKYNMLKQTICTKPTE